MIDQFLKSDMNNRTDEYGGDVAGRCRFALEVVDAIAKAVGPTKVGLRIAPWIRHYGWYISLSRAKHTDILFMAPYLH